MEYARVGFVIDYQNMHLTAHNLFTPNLNKQASLLHPLRLSQCVLIRRAHFFHQQVVQLKIMQVRVFRGLPSNKQEPQRYALNFVEMAQSGDFDLVILMTHDTDLQPALKMANLAVGVQIETAGWSGLNKLRTSQEKLFHTYLTDVDFNNSLDQKDYSMKGRKD